MRYPWTAFLLALRAGLRDLRFWGVFLLALAAGGVFRWTANAPAEASIQVGVSLPAQGGEDFWQALSARSGGILEFVPTEESRLRQKVSAGQWDCGLVLPEDFARRLSGGDTAGLVTLVTGPGSTVYPLVRETASAALAALISPRIAEEYLSGLHLPPAEALPEVPRTSIALKTLDGGPLALPVLARSGGDRLFRGVTAVLLLVWALLAAMDLGRWKESPAAARLRPCVGTVSLLLPRLLASLALAMLAGGGAMLAAMGKDAGLLPLACYLASLGGLALALGCTRRAWALLPVLPPFVAAAALALSPILADTAALFPSLAPVIAWLPTTLYLQGCSGDGTACVKLLAMTAALLLAAMAAAHMPERFFSPSRRRNG